MIKHFELNKTDSTNNFLKNKLRKENLSAFSSVSATYQSSGKGQIGNSWQSKAGKNLLFSYVIYPYIKPENAFYISKYVAVSISQILENFTPGITIKWPNDILYKNKKLAGILIENNFAKRRIKQSIIGIGINVNQENFPAELPAAVSLFQILNVKKHITELKHQILNRMIKNYSLVEYRNFECLDKLYHEKLYRCGQKTLFETDGNQFTAVPVKVQPDGKLLLRFKNNTTKEFDLKQIKFAGLSS